MENIITQRAALDVLYSEYWRHVLAHAKAKAAGIEPPADGLQRALMLNEAYDLLFMEKNVKHVLKAIRITKDLGHYAEYLLSYFSKKIETKKVTTAYANEIYSHVSVAQRILAKKYDVDLQAVTSPTAEKNMTT